MTLHALYRDLTFMFIANEEAGLAPRSHPMKKQKAKKRRRCILTLGVFAVAMGHNAHFGNSDGLAVTTSLAERRTIRFPDGAVLEVNALSSIVVKEDRDRRRVVMAEGEVRASLIHGISKPMDVTVNHLQLEDIGTEYDVLAHDGTTEVSVTAGEIHAHESRVEGGRVDPITLSNSSPERDPVCLKPGDSARFDARDGTLLVSRNPNDMQAALDRASWINRALDTNKLPLDLVVWELNRYNKVQLLIDDPKIAHTRIGAHYRLTDIDTFRRTLPGLGLEEIPVKQNDQGLASTYLVRGISNDSKRRKRP